MMDDKSNSALFLPFMNNFYGRLAKPLAHVGLRMIVGGLLVIEGWPKIVDPYGMATFTEAIGLHPGWLWSAFLAAMQFGGGLLLVVGLFTRPVALANAVMLFITLWFHWSHPYGAAVLTSDGLAAAQIAGQTLFTEDGVRILAADGGALFLHQIQFKAEGLSVLWTVAALFLAAFGAGPLSADRTLLTREF
jgi:putative oxidoreductase